MRNVNFLLSLVRATYILPFLISALMGMGVGGGGLLIIYLTLYLNLPQLTAQGTNLLLFVLAII